MPDLYVALEANLKCGVAPSNAYGCLLKRVVEAIEIVGC
jgi:hypothetical protein